MHLRSLATLLAALVFSKLRVLCLTPGESCYDTEECFSAGAADSDAAAFFSLMQNSLPRLQRTPIQRQVGTPLSRVSDMVGGGSEIPLIPPILYLAIPKTGSTTAVNIIHRMGERRSLCFMLPQDGRHLGYPFPFPGSDNFLAYGPPQNQIDVMCYHSRLNLRLMEAYLKPNPIVFAHLREPTSLLLAGATNIESWESCLNQLEPLTLNLTLATGAVGCFPNHQAFALGWYDFTGMSTEFDKNQSKIKEWLSTLDPRIFDFHLLEHYDEGLVLLREKLQVDLEELKYIILSSAFEEDNHATPIEPTEEELQRIESLNVVDRALYAHFEELFWQKWNEGNVSQREIDLMTLKQINVFTLKACDEGNVQACPPTMHLGYDDYTDRLRKVQAEVCGFAP